MALSRSKKQRDRYIATFTKWFAVRCGICWELILVENEITVDHILPRAKGGTSSRGNMQPAHPKCNVAKADRLESEIYIMTELLTPVKQLAIMSEPEFGLRDMSKPGFWFEVRFGESLGQGSLIVMSNTEMTKIISESGIYSLRNLKNKPCQIEVHGSTVKFVKILK